MNIAIVGSRDYRRLDLVSALVEHFAPNITVVSGGARGVDSVAEETARIRGLQTLIFPADWSKGRGAGTARNADIVAAADVVYAFWDMRSRGTKNSIERARTANKTVRITGPQGPLVCLCHEYKLG